MLNHGDNIELTICSVSYRSHKYLELNWDLIKDLNPGVNFRFLVVDNTSLEEPHYHLNRTSGKFEVFDRVPDCDPESPFHKGRHHALALNKLIKMAETKYALILDPDFYIVRKNWISDIISHMEANDVDILGAPYSPQYEQKYRYFPTIMCCFFNLNNVDKNSIDTQPGTNNPINDEKSKRRIARNGEIQYESKSDFYKFITRPKYIGRVEDTGWSMYKNLHMKNYNVESFLPVMKLPKYFRPIKSKKWTLKVALRNLLRRWYDMPPLLGESWSRVPRNLNSFTEQSFKDRGYQEIIEAYRLWEEFVWKNEPIGFHIRKHSRMDRRGQLKFSDIVDIVNSFSSNKINYNTSDETLNMTDKKIYKNANDLHS
jgi:hypothetical protein